jgi:primosomal protein N'
LVASIVIRKSRRREFEQTLIDFDKGELDMLVGTQMLAKGHDFPNVTFVGVISVDAGLALPDFPRSGANLSVNHAGCWTSGPG